MLAIDEHDRVVGRVDIGLHGVVPPDDKGRLRVYRAPEVAGFLLY
jgi:hypothetical protein